MCRTERLIVSGLGELNMEGIDVTSTRCSNGHISKSVSPYISLEIYPVSGNTVQDCVDDLFTETILSGDNQYDCERCGRYNDAVRVNRIERANECLVVHVNRFTQSNSKDCTKISNSPTLKIKTSRGDTNYTLVGLVEHTGSSLLGGHYISFTRDTRGTWYQESDENVSRVNVSTVHAAESYLLFYVKSSKILPELSCTEENQSSIEDTFQPTPKSRKKDSACSKQIMKDKNQSPLPKAVPGVKKPRVSDLPRSLPQKTQQLPGVKKPRVADLPRSLPQKTQQVAGVKKARVANLTDSSSSDDFEIPKCKKSDGSALKKGVPVNKKESETLPCSNSPSPTVPRQGNR